MLTRSSLAKNISGAQYPQLWRGLVHGWNPAAANYNLRMRSPLYNSPPVTLVSAAKRRAEVDPVRISNLYNGTSDAGSTSATLNLSTATGKLAVIFWLLWDSFADDDDLGWESSVNFNSNAGGILCDPNESTGIFMFAIRNAGATGNNFFDFARPSGAVWHHYVVNIDLAAWATSGTAAGAITSVYVDGVAQTKGSVAQSSGAGAANFGNYTWYFMSRGAASLFADGRMGEFLIYRDRNFSIDEAKLFARGASPFTPKEPFILRFPHSPAAGGPATITGAATIAGTGALSASALVRILAASSQSGSGVLTSSSLVQVLAASSQAGTGSLSSSSLVQVRGSTSLNGSSSNTQSGYVEVHGSTSLTGGSDLNGDGILDIEAASSISGTSDLSASGNVVGVVDPHLNDTVGRTPPRRGIPHREGPPIQLVRRSWRLVSGEALLAGSSTLNASLVKVTAIYFGEVKLLGSHSLNISGTNISLGSGSLPGEGFLEASNAEIGHHSIQWEREIIDEEDEMILLALTGR